MYLESQLCREDNFVFLKQSSCGIHKHRECDAVNQVGHSHFHFISWLSPFNGLLKHNTESLE